MPTRPQLQPLSGLRPVDAQPGRSTARLRIVGAAHTDAHPRTATTVQAGPFLKWVGGKKRLLGQLEPMLPADVSRYAEPFVGGGAMLFHLRATRPLTRAFVADANPEVVNVYTVVRDRVGDLCAALDEHEAAYLARSEEGRKAYFYEVRAQHPMDHEQTAVERAARMIFLNRTCFNGLWRENRSGRFNSPHGRYANPRITRRETLEAAHRALQGVEVRMQDFRDLPTTCREQRVDFVYLDPPYHPISATSSFNAYAAGQFRERDQRALGEVCRELDRMGVRFVLSNSDCPLIREIYDGFSQRIIRAPRAVNSNAAKRGAVNELAVSNFEVR